MPTFVERLLQINDQHELRRVVVLFCFAFLTAGAYVTCRAVADALFLAHVGAKYLPTIHLIATAVVVVLTMISMRWRKRPRGLLPTQLLLAVATVAVPLFYPTPSGSIAVVTFGFLYVLAQLHGTVGMIFLTLLLQEQFHGDEPPRVFGIVGAGATLAAMVFGGVIFWTVSSMGSINLLYIVAVLDLVAVLPVYLLSVGTVNGQTANGAVIPASGAARPTGSSLQLARAILLLVAVKVAALTLVEFQWKVAVADAYVGAEEDMAAYFGLYYTGVNVITGVLQLLLAGRILRHCGVVFPLLLFPSALFCGSLLVLTTSAQQIHLWVATLLKGTESLRRGINDPALQLLFKTLPATQRPTAITTTHGVAKPLAELTAALVLQSIVVVISPHDVSWLVLVLIGFWLYTVFRIRRRLQSSEIASHNN